MCAVEQIYTPKTQMHLLIHTQTHAHTHTNTHRLLQSRHGIKAAQSLGLPFAPALVGFENKGQPVPHTDTTIHYPSLLLFAP